MYTNVVGVGPIQPKPRRESLQPVTENSQIALVCGRPCPGGYLEYTCQLHNIVLSDANQILNFPRETEKQQCFLRLFLEAYRVDCVIAESSQDDTQWKTDVDALLLRMHTFAAHHKNPLNEARVSQLVKE